MNAAISNTATARVMLCLWEVPDGVTIDHVVQQDPDTLDRLTHVYTHRVIDGQRIGQVYHVSAHKLYPAPISVAECPLCGGVVVERVRDALSHMGSNWQTVHQAVCMCCEAISAAQGRKEWRGIEEEAKHVYMHIKPGDFIKAADAPMCMGIVLDLGGITVGTGKREKFIGGYKISTSSGAVDFIDYESAVFIAR